MYYNQIKVETKLLIYKSDTLLLLLSIFRQIVGISMGTNGAPLGADLFLFCYERDFMMSLPEEKHYWSYWSFQLDV